MIIGIVDITTVGATICQREISDLGGIEGEHPEFVVHSLPFNLYRTVIMERDWQKMAELVYSSIEKLQKMGASFIIIPSNTPHYAYDVFAAKASVPVVNLIDVTAEQCKKLQLTKVAILGTMATMKEGLYSSKLKERGIELVVPADEVCEAVDEFIIKEIVPGRVNPKTRDRILTQINSIPCDGCILGCTELPDVYSSNDLGKPAVDTTRLIARYAFDIAKYDE